MNKDTKIIASTTIILTLLCLTFLSFWIPGHLPDVIQFSHQHKILTPIFIISWRILSVVIPPIPGGMVSIVLIPVFGWFWSYIYGLTGVLIGASISFFLARTFREKIVNKFVPLQQLHSWEGRITDKTEFLAFLLIRLTTGPVLDFMSYIAGLSKISYPKFLVVTIIALLPDALVYYLGGEIYSAFYRQNAYLGALSLIIIGVCVYFVSKKGFFKTNN